MLKPVLAEAEFSYGACFLHLSWN